jgi:hypothetical protein
MEHPGRSTSVEVPCPVLSIELNAFSTVILALPESGYVIDPAIKAISFSYEDQIL